MQNVCAKLLCKQTAITTETCTCYESLMWQMRTEEMEMADFLVCLQ